MTKFLAESPWNAPVPTESCVEVFNAAPWPEHPYPWRFAVCHDGRRHFFAGVPNYCETRHQATCRGHWRLRWLRSGRFNERYRR